MQHFKTILSTSITIAGCTLLTACVPERSTTVVIQDNSIRRYCLDNVLYLQFDRMLTPSFDAQTGRVKPCPVDPSQATTLSRSSYLLSQP